MKDFNNNTRAVERPVERTPLIKPCRMIGPDAIACLRSFSQTQTGDRHSYDACRVQRSRSGTISWNIDPERMEHLGYDHPDSYGYLIRRTLIPAAERLEAHLMSISEEERLEELHKLLFKVIRGDGLMFWMLSTRSLRKMLFPKAYNPLTDKRHDNVLYHWNPTDVQNAGKAILLRGLYPDQVETFTKQVMKLTRNAINPSHATPVTVNS